MKKKNFHKMVTLPPYCICKILIQTISVNFATKSKCEVSFTQFCEIVIDTGFLTKFGENVSTLFLTKKITKNVDQNFTKFGEKTITTFSFTKFCESFNT